MPMTASQKDALVLQRKRIEEAKIVVKNKREQLSAMIKRNKSNKNMNLTQKIAQEKLVNTKRQDIFRAKLNVDNLTLAYQSTKKRFSGH